MMNIFNRISAARRFCQDFESTTGHRIVAALAGGAFLTTHGREDPAGLLRAIQHQRECEAPEAREVLSGLWDLFVQEDMAQHSLSPNFHEWDEYCEAAEGLEGEQRSDRRMRAWIAASGTNHLVSEWVQRAGFPHNQRLTAALAHELSERGVNVRAIGRPACLCSAYYPKTVPAE